MKDMIKGSINNIIESEQQLPTTTWESVKYWKLNGVKQRAHHQTKFKKAWLRWVNIVLVQSRNCPKSLKYMTTD